MKKDKNGFIALISILILSSVLLASTLALAQFGIANRFFILNLEQKSMSSKRAEACVEIARIKAYNNPSYTTSATSVTIGGGTCTLTSVAVSGNTTTIKATATEGDAVSNLLVTVDNTTGKFNTFTEVGSF